MKIGFLDSGLGGLTIFKEAINKFKAEYVYVGDIENAPYGVKSKEEVKKYVFNIVDYLINFGCKIIVIACNTATSVCIKDLREKYKSICFIGTEPAIKVAVSSEHKRILVLATSLTLKEEKLHNLVNSLDAEKDAVLLPMDKLVRFAEDSEEIDYLSANRYIKEKFKSIDFTKFSSIVLGCTHFPIFKNEFLENIPESIKVIDSSTGVVNNMIKHAENYLDKNIVSDENSNSMVIVTTNENKYFPVKALQILDIPKENIIFSNINKSNMLQ